jgi:hypothetical protein
LYFLDRACKWASKLQNARLAELSTSKGAVPTLRVHIPGDSCLAIVSMPYSVQLFRSVFDRRAPRSKAHVEALLDKPLAGGRLSTTTSYQTSCWRP